MNRRSIAVFAALSIVVAALAAASVAYRILEAEAAGKKAAAVDFEALTAELSGVRNATDLGDGTLRVALTSHYKNAANILLIAVYERGSGMRWRIPADSDYLPAAENQKPFPQPTYPDRSAYLLSAPLRSDITGRLAVDALYSILDQNSIFLAFRDALLAIGAYLAASALFFAIAAAIGRKAGEGEKAPLAADPSIPPEPGKPATASPLADAYVPPEEDFEVPELKPFGPQTAEPEEQEKEVEDVFAEDLPEPDSEPASGSLAEPGLIPDQAKAGQIPSGSLKAPLAPTSGLYSPASGLGWESYLPERLDAELARSASFEQDLSLLEIAYDGGKRSSAAYTAVAKAITDFFTFRDLAFERGEDGFSVILSNIDIDSALRMSEEFLKKLTFLLRDYRDPLEFLPVFMGLSSRAGRLVDADRISQEAEAALQKARDDCDTHIVAFRPDADKYRRYLASKGC